MALLRLSGFATIFLKSKNRQFLKSNHRVWGCTEHRQGGHKQATPHHQSGVRDLCRFSDVLQR